MLDNVPQFGEQELERGAVAGGLEIAVQGMKEPQRRIRGVVQAFLFAFRE